MIENIWTLDIFKGKTSIPYNFHLLNYIICTDNILTFTISNKIVLPWDDSSK